MPKCEGRLYAGLMREHGSVLAGARLPAALRRHLTPRRALLASGAAGTAAAGGE